MKSVLIDCERLKYPKSGLANVCRSLIFGLHHKKPPFNVALYTPEKNLPTNDFTIIPWKPWQKLFPLSTGKYDLIHVTHQLSEYFHEIKKNQKKVVTLHDLNFLHENLPEKKIKKRIQWVQKNIGNADAVVCISDFAKKDFLQHQHLFRIKENLIVETIHNGLIFPENKKFISEKFNFLISKPFILNIGVLFPKKNQLVLLGFLEKTNVDLVLVSSSSKSEYKNLFLQKIKELKLENRVHILEDVDENDKNFLLQNCLAYIHPSLAEGFGIPPIEAMYFGKPVFLSNKTSLPEIGGNLAFYFDDFSPEKMFEVYDDGMKKFNSDLSIYSKQLHLHALKFGAEKMAENYSNLYSEMMA